MSTTSSTPITPAATDPTDTTAATSPVTPTSAAAATSTTTTATTAPSIEHAQPGLFCRDLNALDYRYSEAVAYWESEGFSTRMDADADGIPCETVYGQHDISEFWGAYWEPERWVGKVFTLDPSFAEAIVLEPPAVLINGGNTGLMWVEGAPYGEHCDSFLFHVVAEYPAGQTALLWYGQSLVEADECIDHLAGEWWIADSIAASAPAGDAFGSDCWRDDLDPFDYTKSVVATRWGGLSGGDYATRAWTIDPKAGVIVELPTEYVLANVGCASREP